jgi:hypothetical protein
MNEVDHNANQPEAWHSRLESFKLRWGTLITGNPKYEAKRRSLVGAWGCILEDTGTSLYQAHQLLLWGGEGDIHQSVRLPI